MSKPEDLDFHSTKRLDDNDPRNPSQRKIVSMDYHTDTINRNGQIYSKKAMRKALREYDKQIKEKKALGRLGDHPFAEEILLKDISHKIIGWQEIPEGFRITFEVLNTEMGKLLGMLDTNKIRPTMNGLGMVNNKNEVTEIKLISIDILPKD